MIIRRWTEGHTGPEIAAELSALLGEPVRVRSVYADVQHLRKALGVELEKRNRSSPGAQPLLSSGALNDVCRRWRAGQNARQIAEAHGLERVQVSRLVTRLRLQGRDLPYRRPQRTAPRALDDIELAA